MSPDPLDSTEVFYLSEPELEAEGREPLWKRHGAALALAGILIVAAFFRFYGRDFDQGTHQHPDERFIVMRTTALSWPSSLAELFNPLTSPLNLRSTRVEANCPPSGCRYPYGSLPVYLTRGVSWLMDTLLPPGDTTPRGYYLGYDGTTVVGRHLSTIFDLITIVLVFLIARRLYSVRTALIAAALVAFAVTHIQLSHFYASDTFLVTFMMGALYFSVVLMQRPSLWAAAGAGACLGLAIASKVSIVPFALVIVAAVVLRAAYRKQTRRLGAELGDPVGLQPTTGQERSMSFGQHLLRKGLPCILVAGVCALLSFAITEPYVLWSFDWSQFPHGGLEAVFDSNPWWRGIQEEAAIQSGSTDGAPYTRQYVGTVPVLYHLQNLVLWGLSPLPGLIVLAGFATGAVYALRKRPAEVLLMAGALPYFASILTLETKWMRYMLPLVPILCILGAAMLVRGMLWANRRFPTSAPGAVGAGEAQGIEPASAHAQPYRATTPAPARMAQAIQRNIFTIMTALALGGAFLWAVAFMNVYSQDHSRVQATNWILQNIPDGAVISSEGWDDALPLWQGERYGHVTFNMYDDHPPEEEFQYLKGLLAQTDYIILASNRLYGSLPKLPWRYQVQVKFYELLFAGKLGYEKVYTAHVTPELLGMRFDDQSADESFTVYDHPRVDVFKKVSNLTDDQLRILFSDTLTRPPGEYSTLRHDRVTDDKSLMVSNIINGQKVADLPALNDYGWNPLGQEATQWIAVLLWLAAVEVFGLIALPVLFTVARNLPDRGYPFAKLAGLLLVSWGVWLAASTRLLPFTVWSILLCMLLLTGLSYVCWRLGAARELRYFFTAKRRLVIFYELVFVVAFAAFLLIRLLNPDLWHPFNGGEKPMEFGFLNAILRSAWMPPLDPFFSGGYINYYYYGQFLVAVLIKLLGIDPAIGFNLAVPVLYAFTFLGAACVAYNLVAWSQHRRGNPRPVPVAGMAFGLLAGVLMVGIGNLHGFWQLLMIWKPELSGPMIAMAKSLIGCADPSQGCIQGAFVAGYSTFNYWDSSRLIANTINEFPFWTFLFADLHPHLIDMPVTLLAAALAVNLAFARPFVPALPAPAQGAQRPSLVLKLIGARVAAGWQWLWGRGWAGALRFGVMALVLGATAVTNSWDFPTFMVVTAGGVLIALLRAGRAVEPEPGSPNGAQAMASARRTTTGDWFVVNLTGLAALGLLAAAAVTAYAPFFLSFKAFYTQIEPLIDGSVSYMRRTTLFEFLMFWALFVFIALSYLALRLWRFPWRDAVAGLRALVEGGTPSHAHTGDLTGLPQQALKYDGPSALPALAVAGAGAGIMSSGGADEATAYHQMSFKADQHAGITEERSSHDSTPETTHSPAVSTDGAEATGLAEWQADSGDSGDGGDSDSEGYVQAELLEEWPGYDAESYWALQAEQVQAQQTNWVAEAHDHALVQAVAEAERPAISGVEYEGVLPPWAGLVMLGATGLLVLLQLVTGQYLLALLIALTGGIAATTLSTTRSAGALGTSLLLVVGLAVAMGVELVYLADHLNNGPAYRMNTVFKFYIQVWVLLAAGGAVAVYYILNGLRDEVLALLPRRRMLTRHVTAAPDVSQPATDRTAVVGSVGALATQASPDQPTEPEEDALPRNWLVWPANHGEHTAPEEPDADVPGHHDYAPPEPEPAPYEGEAVADHAVAQSEQDAPTHTAPRWTPGRLVWSGAFALLLAMCLVYPVLAVPARVADRFAISPPVGTLNGLKFMLDAVYSTEVAPFPINLKYDYPAIQWLNQHIKGPVVLAELPMGYYREYGMRAASNTGLPMVVGGLHQDEQRYGWLVGNRRAEMMDFFTTSDVQRALTYISKYDIDYIYLGQLEKAQIALHGGVGLAKFDQLADPKVGVLEKVFEMEGPAGVPGTTIYRVVRDVRPVVGAPVDTSTPGIAITPLPTATPAPPPTPPVDDPALKALLADVAANPADRDRRMRLIEWYNQHGYFLAAASELEVLVQQNPSDVALRHMLGDAYQAGGQPDRALKAWEDARDVDPHNPAGHNKVGIAYFDRKRYDDAIREFQEAVRNDPAFVESWFHMGEVYEAKGDRNNARDAYQKAIDNSRGQNPWTDMARQRLSRLR